MHPKRILALAILSMFVLVPYVTGQKLTAQEIIAKHLDSIGTAENRSSFKSIVATGEVGVKFLTKKTQPTSGRIVLASEGPKMFFGMNLDSPEYPQERLVFDGNKTAIGNANVHRNSSLGSFIQANPFILTNGLFSGTLGSSWVFLNFADSKAKVSSEGTKKINGRETYAISYTPKGGSDVSIKIFFDQETFRHVRTEYSATRSASMGRTIDESARNRESRIKLTEDFSDFKESSGIMLPGTFRIHFSYSGQNETTEVEWTSKMLEYSVNQKLDPGTFATGN